MGANNSIPANYAPAAYGVLSVDIILTTLAVISRVVSRKLKKGKLGTDDILTYIAYTSNLGLLIAGLMLTITGALDLDTVENQNEAEKHFVRQSYNALAVLYVFSITFIKLSILFLYRRTFTMFNTLFRIAWYAILTLVFLWTATCIILLGLQGAKKLPKGGFSRLGISITGVVNAFSDLLILGLPAFMVSKMRLELKQKIALISIFMLGSVAAVVSVVRGTIFFINRANELNEAYSNYLDIVLTATEASAGLMCACLPLTKPIFIRVSRWWQGKRGLETEKEDWSNLSQTRTVCGTADRERTFLKADDYHSQLLSASHSTRASSEPGNAHATEKTRPLSPDDCNTQNPSQAYQP